MPPTIDKQEAYLRRALDEDSGQVVPTIDELAASLGVAVERVDRVVLISWRCFAPSTMCANRRSF